MSNVLETPDFKNEEEEALWWDKNEDLVLAQFEQAAKNGTLRRGAAKPEPVSLPVPVTAPKLKRTA